MPAPLGSVLGVVKATTAVVSIFLCFLSLYFIRRHSGRATRAYKTLLALTVVAAEVNVFVLQVLLDPVALLPFPCIFTDGLLFNKLQVPITITFSLWVSCFALNAIPYALCVMYRHQVILPAENRYKLSQTAIVTWFAVLVVWFGSLGPISGISREDDRRTLMATLEENQLPSNAIDRIECWREFNFSLVLALFGAAVGSSFLFMVVLLSHTFYTLNRKSNISAKTKNYHRQMTRSLIIQALVPVATLVLPINGVFFQFAVRFKSIGFIPIMFMIIGSHSIVHSVTLMLSTTTYRIAIFKKMTNAPTIEQISVHLHAVVPPVKVVA